MLFRVMNDDISRSSAGGEELELSSLGIHRKPWCERGGDHDAETVTGKEAICGEQTIQPENHDLSGLHRLAIRPPVAIARPLQPTADGSQVPGHTVGSHVVQLDPDIEIRQAAADRKLRDCGSDHLDRRLERRRFEDRDIRSTDQRGIVVCPARPSKAIGQGV